MERRRANSSYVKLMNKDHNKGRLNGGSTSLKRSRSMRASFRMLKGKLNNPALQSPFRLQGVRSFLQHSSSKLSYDAMDEARTSGDEDQANGGKNCTSQYAEQNVTGSYRKDIDDLMSALPIGVVPRKACKLLQIPETYCYKYLSEQEKSKRIQGDISKGTISGQSSATRDLDWNSDIYENLTKNIALGIYGTTRMRTATIRRPMPYINSSRSS